MDLPTAIAVVVDDPAYDKGSPPDGVAWSMRETWTLDDVATFEPLELRTAYEVLLKATDAEVEEALTTFLD
ncbi:hypothetical protein [Lentzea sp. CA-135723]|uniref:hypothetical protein n=1 Tax=Lentzea sp. CA-135723 TaxID=3239950 RepID=UPI003D9103D3